MLIGDGDVAGVIAVTDEDTTIDMYMGQGGAPEGVLAAAALRCVGGQFNGRLVFRNEDEKARARKWGIEDLNRIYKLEDLAKGDCIFAATGVTSGSLLDGVKRRRKPTGEVLPPDAPGRDPIVTRILWLKGQESHNANAYKRYIYIHGTNREDLIGVPASHGCIRLQNPLDFVDKVFNGKSGFSKERVQQVIAAAQAAGATVRSAVLNYKPERSEVDRAPDHFAGTATSWVIYPYKGGE